MLYKKIFKIIGYTILSTILTGLVVGFGFAGYLMAVIEETPKTNLNEFKRIPQTSYIYDSKETLIDEVPTAEKRINVSYEDLPEDLIDAYIATEDRRFFEHNGVDFRRLGGAALATVKVLLGQDGLIEGGSTITQQLVKNILLTPDRTIKRKAQEMVLAMVVSNNMSKEEVLTTYLNTIYLGGYANGVEMASKQYFNKHTKDLNLIESAFLAGITQSPTNYYPFSDKNIEDPSKYLNRVETVLDSMLLVNSITQKEYTQAVEDLNSGKLVFTKEEQLTYNLDYEWYNRQLLQDVKDDLKEKYGYTDEVVANLLANGGLKIYTAMDKDLQDYAENVLYNMEDYVDAVSYSKETGEQIRPQASIVVTDYKTGQVKVAIGGNHEQDALTINRALSPDTLKPVGSSAKPFTVYAPALDVGLYTPTSIVKDSALDKSLLDKYHYTFQPQNDQLTYYGNITLQSALARSLNTIAIQTVDKLGLQNSIKYGEAFGLKYNDQSKGSIAAVALGQFNNDPEDIDGGNPLMVAEGYGVFGNDGVRVESILYTKVLDRNGNILIDNTPETTKVLRNQTAYEMYKMMEETTRVNTSNVVLFDGMSIAGKSGTSEDSENLWFAGLTPYYSAAVWVGNDVPNRVVSSGGVPMYGNNTSGLLWKEVMRYAHKGLAYKTVEQPKVAETRTILSESEPTPQTPQANIAVKPNQNALNAYESAKQEEVERIKKEQEDRKAQEAQALKEAEERAKQEQEAQLQKVEEERIRLEEERKAHEEEQRRKEEEQRKKQEEEQKRKEEEEQKRKEEEEKKKQEEEDKKHQEEIDKNNQEKPKPPTNTQTPTDGPVSFN